MHYLVTGTAGFIGFHVARRLISAGHTVTGVDAMTEYYNAGLKRARHDMLGVAGGFRAVEARIEDTAALMAAAEADPPDVVIHLAAQAGVRHSLDRPDVYVSSNLAGTASVLEMARRVSPRHFVNASTSSVYGISERPEFTETDPTDQPVSLYAATKKGAEALTHSYAHLYGLPVTTLRFFTVYGPWGRPDMAYYLFTRAILAGEPIEVYGGGTQERDFTFIDDLVWALCALVGRVPDPASPVVADGVADTVSPVAPYRTVNIAAGRPVALNALIAAIEKATGTKARRRDTPAQPGDVPRTHASPALLEALTGYVPDTPLEEGVATFVDWYRGFAGR